MGFFSSKKTTYDPMSAYTPQQRQAVEALMSLASTGSGGGITLGEQYGGNLGNYQQTEGELQALQGIQGLISGEGLKTAENTFTDFANTTFNPDDPSSGYAAFSRALAKSGQESQDLINREAARTGGAFGSGRGRDTADLAENLANQRGQFLASLFQSDQNKKLAGAQGLQGLAGTQANLFNQLASQAQIERLLKDQQAKDQYTEFQRARGEELSRLGLMQNEVNNPLGTITTKSPSTFAKLAPSLGAAAGFLIGGPAGAAIGGSLGGAVGAGSSPVTYNAGSSKDGFDFSKLLSLFGGGGKSSPITASNSRLIRNYNSGSLSGIGSSLGGF